AAARGHGHHLLAVHRVRHGAARHVTAEVDSPQLFAGFGVERVEVAFELLAVASDPAAAAPENQLAGSRQNTRPRLADQLVFPNLVARLGIERPDSAVAGGVLDVDLGDAAEEPVAGNVFGFTLAGAALVVLNRAIEATGPR